LHSYEIACKATEKGILSAAQHFFEITDSNHETDFVYLQKVSKKPSLVKYSLNIVKK